MTARICSSACSSDGVLSDDVLPADVLPDDVLPDDVLPDDVLPDDAFADDAFPDDAFADDAFPDDAFADDAFPDDAFADDSTVFTATAPPNATKPVMIPTKTLRGNRLSDFFSEIVSSEAFRVAFRCCCVTCLRPSIFCILLRVAIKYRGCTFTTNQSEYFSKETF